MNVGSIIQRLKEQYPNNTIILNKNNLGEVTEILCEIEPASEHPEYSFAIVILDSSALHYHKLITETYKVIKGSLNLFIDDKVSLLNEGDTYKILPGQKHRAEGNETWFEVTSNPGWTFEDHILVKKQEQIADVILGEGKLAGKGVYANKDFKKGDIVIKYNLRSLSKAEYNRLPKSEKIFTHIHMGKYYLYSEPERYVNHSKNPNSYQDIVNKSDIANRDIKKGEMITTDATKDDVSY